MYRLAKFLGLFKLSEKITAKKLRILCYHGVSTTDTHVWRPMLFMRMETFEKRMQALKQTGVNVLSLDDAVSALQRDDLPPLSTVLTIDDGFSHTATKVAPLLKALGLPATVYATTYYAEKQSPIFRLAVQYCLWKAEGCVIDAAALQVPVNVLEPLPFEFNEKSAWKVIAYGEEHLGCDEQTHLIDNLCRTLGLDFNHLIASRDFHLMSADEMSKMMEYGVSIELHTRRHSFPVNETICKKEIEENRRDIENMCGRSATRHFCYPSGEWNTNQFRWLSEVGVVSATTTDVGLNKAGDNPLQLNRYLDADDIDEIEFLAELSGFSELMRRIGNINALLTRRRKYHCGSILIESEISRILES